MAQLPRGPAAPPVLIAGAGPVGMLTALLLARVDIPSVVLEAAPAVRREGSKAICFQRDVLDILDRVGVAERAVAEGVTWRTARTYHQGEEILTVELPDSGDDSLPPFINLSQSALEALLADRVAAEPLVDVRFGHRVVGVPRGLGEADEDVGVTVAVDPQVARDRRADTVVGSHLVGADGPRSTVRKAMGATFDGSSFDEQFLIADIEADLPFPAERRFHFDPGWNPGRQVLVHQQPHGIWRIDWQVPADFDLAAEQASGGLDARVRMITGDRPYRLDWVSAYRFHQRLASTFARGRVFLAGDAAHLMSPFGARGLNSGAQDAENLAWKLAWTRHGWGGAALLGSYEAERRPAAEENLRVTGETMRFLVPQTPVDRRRREAALAAARADPSARGRIDSGRLAEPFWYLDSPLTTPAGPVDGFPRKAGARRPVVPGVLCPDHPMPGGGRLRQRFGRSVVLLSTGPAGADAASRLAEGRAAGPVTCVDGAVVPGLAEALEVDGDQVVVVRPDGHIAAICPPDAVAGAVRTAVGHHPGPATTRSPSE